MFVNLDIFIDIIFMIGILVVLVIFGILFNGLIGVVCVGYINGEYILNICVEE